MNSNDILLFERTRQVGSEDYNAPEINVEEYELIM
jgi:hypothetical protein